MPAWIGSCCCRTLLVSQGASTAHVSGVLRPPNYPSLDNTGPLTFGQDDNSLLLVDADGVHELPRAPMLQVGARASVHENGLNHSTCFAKRAPVSLPCVGSGFSISADGAGDGRGRRLHAQRWINESAS